MSINQSYQQTTEKNREIVILAGQVGLERFNVTLQKQNDIDFAEYLHQSGHIKYEEKERIISMINSEDVENYEVAKVLLKNIQLKHPY